MKRLVLVLDNIRSAYNVGSLLRTADGLGIQAVYVCGLTPHPRQNDDKRLPHAVAADERKLAKTALGAEQTLDIQHFAKVKTAIGTLRDEGFLIVALEQTPTAIDLTNWNRPEQSMALVLGHELNGVSSQALSASDVAIKIAMRGHKESFNVSVAGAIAMYELTR